MKKTNNKGLSYVELILVIGILVIATGIVSLSIGIISRNNVTAAVNKIDVAFKRAQSSSMAKGDKAGALVFFCENGSLYYKIGVDSSEKNKVATGPVKVKFGSLELGNGENITYMYNQATGSVSSSGTYDYGSGSYSSSGGVASYVNVENNSHTQHIHLIPQTGKTIIND
jgi:type II secretory pathway pseudopilin PulG